MAARQYIGARYVPAFFENSATGDSTWAANTAYEPLTIVTYNGNSYTSKKAVPAGVGSPDGNPAYWASTGIFNAQVESLRQEIATKETNYANRKIILISDSYGVRDSDFSGATWFDYFISTAVSHGLPAANIYTNASRGASFCRSGYLYLNVLQGLNNTITDKDAITDIIVGGGYNDLITYRNDYYDQTLAVGAADFMTYVRQNYINAKVTFMNMANAVAGLARQRLLANLPELETACEANDIRFIDGVGSALDYNGGQLADGIHPSVSGQTALGRLAFNAFIGGSSYVNHSFLATPDSNFTAAEGVTLSTGWYLYEYSNGIVKNMYMPDAVISLSAAALPTPANPLVLGTFSGEFILKNTLALGGVARANGRSTIKRSGVYHECNFMLWVDNNDRLLLAADNTSVIALASYNDNISEIHLRSVVGLFNARTV